MDREKGMQGKPGSDLAQGEEALAAANEALQAEERRLQTTREEIGALTEQVKSTDPDDGKAFTRLVQARDAARGREEALVVRVEAAAARRAELERVAREARRAAHRAEVETARAQLLAHSDATTAKVRAEAGDLVVRLRQHQALFDQVREMQRELDLMEGRTHLPPQVPGTAWSAIPLADPSAALVAVGEQLGRILTWEAGAAGRRAMEAAEERRCQALAAQVAEAERERPEGPSRPELDEGLEVRDRLGPDRLARTVRVPEDYDPMARIPRPGDYDPLTAGRS